MSKKEQIIEKLKELNYLLNTSSKITRKISFIYAIKDDFFEEVDNLINKDDVILVKASRGMRFEEIISKLKELK